MKKVILAIILFSVLFTHCISSDYKAIKKDNLILEGNISFKGQDTIFQGPIKTRNANDNILISVTNFENNKRNGPYTEYYSSGKIYSSSVYDNDLLDGKSYVYDTMGNRIYESYLYKGLHVGPVKYYNNDKIDRYHFETFEGEYLYQCEYKSSKEILEQGNLLNYVAKYENDDNVLKLSVFLYLISPPHKRVTYKLYDKNKSSHDSVLVFSWFSDTIPFKEFVVEAPKEGHIYLWNLEAYYYNKKVSYPILLDDNMRTFRFPSFR